ncbi:MAG: LysR family transcriptional regulator [Alphaproteobacteria bacterium]|nr:MAG: LysR family transcriptional regulator [Alphaproteobacteria bacterium]PZO41597.1 MAG: LysR family transcriptional regulator [Alphaproteobacteria bacterium]
MSVSPFDLNLRHLRALSVIIARGNMSRAAEAVGLSQPALTQGLAKLERTLGARLLVRNPDGVRATDAGQTLAERTDRAFSNLAEAARQAGRSGFARPESIMTATQLRAFLALTDAGSFVAAARATGLSQPSLHAAVRDLEKICAVPILERQGRGVILTKAGLRLARGARLARSEIAAGLVEILPGSGGDANRITIGAMPLSRAVLLPSAVSAMVAAEPGFVVDIVDGAWRELVDPLREGILDVMVGALREETHPDLVQKPLLEDRVMVVGRAGHPLSSAISFDAVALGSYPWVIGRPGSPLRLLWQAMFADGPMPASPVECGSVTAIRGILRGSDLLTLLSYDQVRLEIEAGVLAPIGRPLAETRRTIGITTRADWWPTPSQSRFLALIDDAARTSIREIE